LRDFTNIGKLEAFGLGMWLFYALMAALFAALTAIFAKVGLAGVDAALATAIRTGVALVLACVAVFLAGAQADLPLLTRRQCLFLCLSGVATGLSWLCYFHALKTGPVSKVAPVDKLSVILTIALAVVFLGEPVSWKTAVGCLLLLSGLLFLL